MKILSMRRTYRAAVILTAFCLVFGIGGYWGEKAHGAVKALSGVRSMTVKTKTGSRIRSSASTSSKIVTTVGAGKSMTVTAQKNTSSKSCASKYVWYYTSTYKGYIRSDLVKATFKTVTGTTTAAVNMRKGPQTTFGRTGTLAKGKTVYIYLTAYNKSGQKWYRIRNGSGSAYVSADYVKVKSAAGTPKPAAPKPAVPKPSAPKPSAPSKSTSESVSGVNTMKAKITAAGGVNVRASYSTSSKVVGSAAKGKTITVTSQKCVSPKSCSDTNVWYYTGTYKGYVRSDLVSETFSAVSGTTTAAVNIRKGPETTFGTISTLPKGKAVTVYLTAYNSKGEKWYRIKNGSGSAYASADYVKIGGSASGSGSAGAPSGSGSSSGSGASGGSSGSGSTSGSGGSTGKTDYLTSSGFPSSYLPALNALSKSYPNWKFTPVNTGLNWSDAVSKMTSSYKTNLIYYTYAPSYKNTEKGCYNYLTNTYTGLDSSAFVGASKEAVAYYMDPRNWLQADRILQFVSNEYHDYQNEAAVQAVLKVNPVLNSKTVAGYYVKAGKKYNISPIYLAAKSINELGTSTMMVDGKHYKYKNCYNAFNIGANDSKNGGALNGLAYAQKAGWNTLEKAIVEGAKFLKGNFIGNRQYSAYLEHFNVLNGLSRVGTHVYMTAVYAPMSQGSSLYTSYKSYGLLSKQIEFFIPVYNNMPVSNLPKPSTDTKKDNNFYLKTLTVKAGSKTYTLIGSDKLNYNVSFTLKVPAGTKEVTIGAVKASKTAAAVTGTGTKALTAASQTFTVNCKSSSGLTRTYKVTITR